jgi:hypothetical protein
VIQQSICLKYEPSVRTDAALASLPAQKASGNRTQDNHWIIAQDTSQTSAIYHVPSPDIWVMGVIACLVVF